MATLDWLTRLKDVSEDSILKTIEEEEQLKRERYAERKKIVESKLRARRIAQGKKIKQVVKAQKVEVISPNLYTRYAPDYKNAIEIRAASYKYTIQDLVDILKNPDGGMRVNIGFYGPAGTGKTSIVRYIRDLMNKEALKHNIKLKLKGSNDINAYKALPYPLYDVNCHEATRSEDLTVSTRIAVRNGETVMEEVINAAVKAFSEGGILNLEEWDTAPAGVWAELNALLEPSTEFVTYYANGPKQYVRHPNFVVMATGNTRGRGDQFVDYAGTQMQNKAFISRFRWFPITYLSEEEEINLLVSKGLSAALAKTMQRIATNIRNAVQEERLDITISIRTLLSWAQETIRLAKKASISFDQNEQKYWSLCAEPAAYPVFIWQASPEDQVAVKEYLHLF